MLNTHLADLLKKNFRLGSWDKIMTKTLAKSTLTYLLSALPPPNNSSNKKLDESTPQPEPPEHFAGAANQGLGV